MHLRLDLHSFLPCFAMVATAGQHDNRRARELCAGLLSGQIVLFDKACVDFVHLCELAARGVQWVTRAKDQAYLSKRGHSFTRLFTVTRSTPWERIDLLALLKSHGTATGRMRVLGSLDQAWLPGFSSTRT